MRTLKVFGKNGSVDYASVVRTTSVSIVLEMEDRTNKVFSTDGYLIQAEMETDLFYISRTDLPRLNEILSS